MIEYLYREGEEPCSKEPLMVRKDGIICGAIHKVEGGFQYFPKDSKNGGEVMTSIDDVQVSLVDDE